MIMMEALKEEMSKSCKNSRKRLTKTLEKMSKSLKESQEKTK